MEKLIHVSHGAMLTGEVKHFPLVRRPINSFKLITEENFVDPLLWENHETKTILPWIIKPSPVGEGGAQRRMREKSNCLTSIPFTSIFLIENYFQ
jgi:hypothetical protein